MTVITGVSVVWLAKPTLAAVVVRWQHPRDGNAFAQDDLVPPSLRFNDQRRASRLLVGLDGELAIDEAPPDVRAAARRAFDDAVT